MNQFPRQTHDVSREARLAQIVLEKIAQSVEQFFGRLQRQKIDPGFKIVVAGAFHAGQASH